MNMKPNITGMLYWAIVYGIVAITLLWIITFIASLLHAAWVPVCIIGMLYGAYRKYRKDRKHWLTESAIVGTSKSAHDEIRDAASDVISTSAELGKKL